MPYKSGGGWAINVEFAKKIMVNTTPSYEVFITHGLRHLAGSLLAERISACRLLLVCDRTVNILYGDQVEQSFTEAGFTVYRHTFATGEANKSLEQLSHIWDKLAAYNFSRSDWLVALGGGVTGDLAGFAAATYLRGIPCLQMPTTLMAQIDSCIGGKSAINLTAGKNLVGTIHQPALVLCDCNCLQTLPQDIYNDGLAEAIKYALLEDNRLLLDLEDNSYQLDTAGFITRCLEIKTKYITADVADQGRRQLLNMGHTVGHAIEQCSNYSIRHGQAVASGLAIEMRAAVARGLIDYHGAYRLEKLLQLYGLPITTDYSASQLAQAALADKKRRGDTIFIPVPAGFGECYLHPLPVLEVEDYIAGGLAVSL